MKVYKYEEFINESKIKNFIAYMLLGLGLSKADAQYINTDQKAKIIEILYDYNKSPYDLMDLKSQLKLNNVSNVDTFIHAELNIRPDKTVVIKPSFLPNLELYLNTDRKRYGLNYKINL